MPFHTLLQWLRPASADELLALERYRAAIVSVAQQTQDMSERWLAFAQLESDAERLANTAAVNRWELAMMGERLRELQVPRPAAATDRDVRRSLTSLTRAFQLLANGYRFHKSDAVCDGQALLVDRVGRLQAASRQLHERQPRVATTAVTRGSSAS